MVFDLHSPIAKEARKKLSLLVYPMQIAIDYPVNAVKNISHNFLDKQKLIHENEQLKTENFLYQAKLQKLKTLELENHSLRDLFDSVSDRNEAMIIARIIKVDADPFSQVFLLNKGGKNGSYTGQPVIDANGLMGSIVSFNDKVSDLLLITDPASSVPVVNLRNGIRTIASGSGNLEELELQYIPLTSDIKVGDVFITSGLGRKYPYGYPVGKVIKAEKKTGNPFLEVIVKPLANLKSSSMVLMINPKIIVETEENSNNLSGEN